MVQKHDKIFLKEPTGNLWTREDLQPSVLPTESEGEQFANNPFGYVIQDKKGYYTTSVRMAPLRKSSIFQKDYRDIIGKHKTMDAMMKSDGFQVAYDPFENYIFAKGLSFLQSLIHIMFFFWKLHRINKDGSPAIFSKPRVSNAKSRGERDYKNQFSKDDSNLIHSIVNDIDTECNMADSNKLQELLKKVVWNISFFTLHEDDVLYQGKVVHRDNIKVKQSPCKEDTPNKIMIQTQQNVPDLSDIHDEDVNLEVTPSSKEKSSIEENTPSSEEKSSIEENTPSSEEKSSIEENTPSSEEKSTREKENTDDSSLNNEEGIEAKEAKVLPDSRESQEYKEFEDYYDQTLTPPKLKDAKVGGARKLKKKKSTIRKNRK